jgi:hypothetical protein
VVAPWWLRWFTSTLWSAVWIIPFGIWLLPNFIANIGWTYGITSLVGFSVLASGLITLVQRPTQRSFAAAVAGTTTAQRSQIVRALRRGDVPSDPNVLAAAVRVGTLTAAYRRRSPRWLKSSPAWLPVLWIGIGVLELFVNDTWRRWVWFGLAAFMAGRSIWAQHRVKRFEENFVRLRSEADPTSAASAADENVLSLPPQRLRARLAVAVMVGAALGVMTFISDLPRPGCHTADAVVGFIYANRDILKPDLAATGPYSPDQYQRWADHLQGYSRQESAPTVAPHLRRIASLSEQVIPLVRQARPNKSVGNSPNKTRNLQTAYQQTVSQLIDEDNVLARTCHR